LSKTATGIPGFDAITQGGLPAGRLTLVTGDTGSGKSNLSLQTLVGGAERFREPGLFVSFEEPPEEVAANAARFGWRVVPWSGQAPAVPAGTIPILDANPSPDTLYAGSFDLAGLLAALTAAVERTGARRIVLDGLDVLLDLLDTRACGAGRSSASRNGAARAASPRSSPPSRTRTAPPTRATAS
jgi:circadian clock protein KaiC